MDKRTTLGWAGGAAGVAIAAGAAAFFTMRGKQDRPGADDAPDYTARGKRGGETLVGRTVTIRKPRAELFEFWRDFQNLPRFMENVERIEAQGDGSATWTIKAPAGRTVAVVTRVSSEDAGRRIAWKSTEDSEIQTEGEVRFADAPGDRGTRVTLEIAYSPPGGAMGRTLAKAFLREPEVQARHDLKRFKMLMETGEIATSERRADRTRAAKQQEKR